MKVRQACAVVALCAAAALTPAPAVAQGEQALQFQASLYLYLPSVGGRTVLGPSDSGVQLGFDPNKVLERWNPTIMGTLEVHQGRWGGFTDLLYVDLSQTKAASTDLTIGGAPLPAGASARLKYDLRGEAWTVAGTYRGIPDRDSPADLLAGVRLLGVRQALDWQTSGNVGSIPVQGRSGDQAVSLSNWDVVAGVKGRLTMVKERTWFVPYYVDIGTGESKFTWQLMIGFGWTFGWGEFIGAWRHLDYRMKSGAGIESLSFDGPSLGAQWRW